MTLTVGELQAVLSLDMSAYTAGLKKAQADGNSFTSGLIAKFSQAASGSSILSTAMSGIGLAAKAGLVIAGAGIAAIGTGLTYAVSAAADFESAMSNVAAIAELDVGSSAFEQLRQQALDLAATTKFTSTEIAEGQAVLAQAGYSATQIFQALPGVVSLAAVENMNFADTAQIVTSAIVGFGLATTDASHVADVLAQASIDSNASISSLGQSFKYIAPVAAALKLNFEDMTAAISLVTNAGIQGSTAGRNLATGLQRLAGPTDAAQKVMQKLGITVTDAQGNFLSFPQIIDNMSNGCKGMSDSGKLAALGVLVGKDSIKSFLPLLAQGSTGISAFSNNLKNSTGTAAEVAAKKMDNLKGSLKLLESSMNNLAVIAAGPLASAFKPIVDAMIPIANSAAPLVKNALIQMGTVLQQVGSAILPQLAAAWATLRPAIVAALPALAQVAGTFLAIAAQAVGWGAQIVASIAAGMLRAFATVVAVLQQLGAIIRYWLAPHSPPKIVPDLDKYGEDAGNIYAQGFVKADVASPLQALGQKIASGFGTLAGSLTSVAQQTGNTVVQALAQSWNSADFSALKGISDQIGQVIRSVGESGAIPKDGIIPLILGSRTALSGAINDIKRFGTVSQESMQNVLSSVGPIAPEVQGLISAYFDLESASRAVAEAQDELNRVSQEYADKIAPLQDQLDSINKQQQQIRDKERLAELQEKLTDVNSTEDERALAALEIQEIQTKQQIDSIKEEQDAAVDSAQSKLDAAKATKDAAEANYNTQKAAIEATQETNSLMQEQVKILKELAEAGKGVGGGGGGGGGLGGLGALGGGGIEMPELPAIPTDVIPPELTANLQSLKEIGDGISTTFATVGNSFTATNQALSGLSGTIGTSIGSITEYGASWSTVGTSVSTALGSLGGLVSTVIGGIATYLATNGAQMSSDVSTTWSMITSTVQQQVTAMASIVTSVASGITSFLSAHGSEIGEIFKTAWSIVIAIIQINVAAYQTLVVGPLSAVASLISAHGSEISAVFTTYWNAISFVVRSVLAVLNGAVQTALQLMTGNSSAALQTLKDGFMTAFNSLTSIVSSAMNSASDAVFKALNDLAAKALKLGENVAKGVADGIKNGAKWIADAATSAAKAAYDAAANFLKTGSPSKLMHDEIGNVGIAQGISTGIMAGYVAIKSAVINVSEGMLGQFKITAQQIKTVFATVVEFMTGQKALLESSLSSSNALEGILPKVSDVEAAQNAFRNVVDTLQESQSKIQDIDQEFSDSKEKLYQKLVDIAKKTNDDLLQSDRDYNKAVDSTNKDLDKKLKSFKDKGDKLSKDIIDVQGTITDLQSESLGKSDQKSFDKLGKDKLSIEEEIARLSAITNDQDALMAERIADLKQKAADKEKEQQEILTDFQSEQQKKIEEKQEKLNDLVQDRKDLEDEIATTRQEAVDKLAALEKDHLLERMQLDNDLRAAQLQGMLDQQALQQQFDDKKKTALLEQAAIIKELAEAQINVDRQATLFKERQAIADKARVDIAQVQQQLTTLSQKDPEIAAKILAERSKEILDLAKLQQDLLTETDPRKAQALKEQITLTQQLADANFALLSQQESSAVLEQAKKAKSRPETDALLGEVQLIKDTTNAIKASGLVAQSINSQLLQSAYVASNSLSSSLSSIFDGLGLDIENIFTTLRNATIGATTIQNTPTYQVNNPTYNYPQSGLTTEQELKLLALLH